MTIVLVLLAVSVVAYAVMAILTKLSDKWSRLPHFFYNHVGGVWAVCGVTDYKNSLALGQVFKRSDDPLSEPLVGVTDTLAFSNRPGIEGANLSGGLKYNAGGYAWVEHHDFYPNEIMYNLFVPFASERFMDAKRQKTIFRAQDPDAFIVKKRRENEKADFRLRFGAWAKRHEIEEWKSWAFVASIVMLFVLLIAGVYFSDKSLNERTIFVHTTNADGTVHEFQTKGSDEMRLLMYEDSGDDQIVKARAWKIQELGGGVSRVCGIRVSKRVRCGFAPTSLNIKEGDEIYIRDAKLFWWSDSPTTTTNEGRVADSWLVGKHEAENLVVTNNFKIIE